MQLYFIRHGQSVNNALWERTESNHGRKMDPELTDTGHQQAELLAQFLTKPGAEMEPDAMDFQNRAGFNITHIYTSLMMRAVATGTVIADTLDLPLVAWHDLHESGGLFLEEKKTGELVGQAGPNRAFFEQHYPKLEHNIPSGDEGWWNSPFDDWAFGNDAVTGPTRFRGARSNEWPWQGPWSKNLPSFWPMNRPAIWTRAPQKRYWPCWPN